MILKVLAFILVAIGAVFIFGARTIVNRFKLNETQRCSYESEMKEEEIELYKTNKAVINIKMLGMIIALPGIVLILVVFR